MEEEKKFDVVIHFIMAFCGGYFGIYAFVNRLNVFGSAQTANLIDLVRDIVGNDFVAALLRIGALCVFLGAMIFVTILEKKTKCNVKYIALYMECIIIFLLGCLPTDMPPLLALYPMFFMTAFQWCAFKGAQGYVCSTIFSTNNLKQTCCSITEYLLLDKENVKERKEKVKKASFFGGTIVSFQCGVVIGCIISLAVGIKSIWLCFIPVLIAFLLLSKDEKRVVW